jgi:hypothetical protein
MSHQILLVGFTGCHVYQALTILMGQIFHPQSCASGEFVSMGVWSDHGAYSIADSLVFSVPVVCQGGGKYHVYKGRLEMFRGFGNVNARTWIT